MLIKYLRTLLLLGSIFASFPALAVEGYVCVTELSAGFSFDQSNKQWSATTFKAGRNLLVQRPTESESKRGLSWVVKEVGSTQKEFTCKNEFNESGYLNCDGFGDFMFNKRNGRFLSTYTPGYVTDGFGGPEGSLTPAITAGKCSPL